MKLLEASMEHADIVGEIHSLAWQQAYENVFPVEYVKNDTPNKRRQEFLEEVRKEGCKYYLIYNDKQAVGIIKIFVMDDICEIVSIYFLKQYCNRGFGTQTIEQIKEIFEDYPIQLWTLEENTSARFFYEKNNFVLTGKRRIVNRGKEYIQVQYEYSNISN